MASPARSRPALPRTALLALIAIVATAFAATMAISATPAKGTITQEPGDMENWKGTITGRALQSACGEEDADSLPQCDSFELTVDVDPIFWKSSDGGLEVEVANSNTSDTDDDLNVLIYDNRGTLVSSANKAGEGQRETVSVTEPSRAGSPYRVVVYETGLADVDFSELEYSAGARIEARPDAPAGGADNGGQSDAPIPTEIVKDKKCVDGFAAGVFPCKGVDLESFVPISGLGLRGLTGELNDIWGWTDPETNREYALVGKFNGTAFVDVTDPKDPKFLGELPTYGNAESPVFNIWRDIKTYKNKAYIVSEEPAHGMQVFDLTKLRGLTAPPTPPVFREDAHYAGFGKAHNISINEQTGFAYVIGTDTCSGGSHVLNLNDLPSEIPSRTIEPVCVGGDGYTHDNQCVVYDGPDTEFTDHEICFDYNEDSVTIQDVTDKAKPVMLSKRTYTTSQYTHQGWLTKDKRHLLFNDELDEQKNGTDGTNTTTRILNIDKLRNPSFVGEYVHPTKAIDHNNYIKGDRAYQANYRAGLRILDVSKVATGDLSTEAFFDVYPADNDGEFNGAWSTYPFFKSGTVIVSGIEQGLFVLSEQRNTSGSGGTSGSGNTSGSGDTAGSGNTAGTGDTAGSGTTTGTGSTVTPAPAPPTSANAPKPSVKEAAAAKRQARLRLTRRVLSRGRVRLGCTVRGATKRSCVVRLYVRKGKRLARVKQVRFSAKTKNRTVRLRQRRNLVVRATAKTTTGTTLRASRTLRYTKR